jgi:hypothetical protein
MTIWPILRPLELFYGHLVYFVLIWYIFPRFGILDQEKSGNPAPESENYIQKLLPTYICNMWLTHQGMYVCMYYIKMPFLSIVWRIVFIIGSISAKFYYIYHVQVQFLSFPYCRAAFLR